MRWFKKAKTQPGSAEKDVKGLHGRLARQKAEQDLDHTLKRWDEVHEVSASLRELRIRNHFGDQIAYVMRGGMRNDNE